MARCFIPRALASPTSFLIRLKPSSKEYSVWTCKCAKSVPMSNPPASFFCESGIYVTKQVFQLQQASSVVFGPGSYYLPIKGRLKGLWDKDRGNSGREKNSRKFGPAKQATTTFSLTNGLLMRMMTA